MRANGRDVGPRVRAGVALVLVTLAPGVAARAETVRSPASPRPVRDLDEAGRDRFRAGLAAFSRDADASAGLGPVFNARSCAACHRHPAVGGSSEVAVERFGRLTPAGFDPMVSEGGPVVQREGLVLATCAVRGEQVPADATVVARRDTPALFGLGYVDAIPDARILRIADPSDRDRDGVSGRAHVVGGRVARFGWKAQITSAHEFVAAALLNELGITSPDFPEELSPQGQPVRCDPMPDPEDDGALVGALTDFVSLLGPPPRAPHARGARRGGRVFHRAGCAACHRPRLRSDFPLPRRRVALYSDLLLHDMGPDLADGVEQGMATGAEFRTPPLWGVGQSAPYLHDGRAHTLADAIALHAGEAEPARRAFLALREKSRRALLAYLVGL